MASQIRSLTSVCSSLCLSLQFRPSSLCSHSAGFLSLPFHCHERLGSSQQWFQECYVPPVHYNARQRSSQSQSFPPPRPVWGQTGGHLRLAPQPAHLKCPLARVICLRAHSCLGPMAPGGALLVLSLLSIWEACLGLPGTLLLVVSGSPFFSGEC